MFDLNTEWSGSLAGCGFMGIHYVGVISCIFERFPRFIQDASKIYGASAGALMAAVVALGIPLDKCCTDLMHMAKEARKHKLGPLHLAYNLLQLVQESLLEKLPEDAHVRVSGKLCLSLTRVSDGKNLLVSQFDSRDKLIQYYVDGAVSDNLPCCQLGRTITVSPYAGESDLCPRASTLTFHEVHFNNVSIHVNSENLYRVTSTFFPRSLSSERDTGEISFMVSHVSLHACIRQIKQKESQFSLRAMVEIYQNGFLDALRFLQENDLISSEAPQTGLRSDAAKSACCELMQDLKGERSGQRDHLWLNPKLTEYLPADLQRVLCKACRETHTAGGLWTHITEYLPKKVTSYLAFDSTAPSLRVDHVCADAQAFRLTCSGTGEATVKSPPAEGRGWALGRVMGLLQNLRLSKMSDPK